MLTASKIAKRKLISENSWTFFMIPTVMNVTYQLPEILSETDLGVISLSRRYTLTEIWPLAALQRISLLVFIKDPVSVVHACGKVPLLGFTKKIQIISNSAMWCIVEERNILSLSGFCRLQWLKWPPLGPSAKLLTGPSKCVEVQVFPRTTLWLTCE